MLSHTVCFKGTAEKVRAMIDLLNSAGDFPVTAEVVIAAPTLFLQQCKASFRPDIFTAAEDIGVNPGFGAFTGETSDAMLIDSGIQWTLTGHSERRVGFGIPVMSLPLVCSCHMLYHCYSLTRVRPMNW